MSNNEIPDPTIAPSRYIEKVSLDTGEILNEEILPEQLLIHAHRDFHFMDFEVRRMMSRIVNDTGDPEKARAAARRLRRRGYRFTHMLSRLIGEDRAERVSMTLFGLKHPDYYFRFKSLPVSDEEAEQRIQALRAKAVEQFSKAVDDTGKQALRVLLTGGTGFIGQEIIKMAADDEAIAEVVILIRPKKIFDRATKQVVGTITPAERGAELLVRLGLETPEQQAKFRFIAGDIEEPMLGVAADEMATLQQTITHLIHSAASVSFDDTYEATYHSNVTGTLNTLGFSLQLQNAPNSPFVNHIGIETSYIHGRQMREPAREDAIIFPRNFYNNYYEVTKAIASIETETHMLMKGLRVVQLCPAIVIGKLRNGNNGGDTKVVNAPINMFGRAHENQGDKPSLLARLSCAFPGDPIAQINLITVDWVVQGIMAAVHHPQAVGERIHLAADKRLTPKAMAQIFSDELGIEIFFIEPTLFRNLLLPVFIRFLNLLKQEKQANAIGKLATLFGGYSEWDQPIHQVGNDIRVLQLKEPRPDMEYAFRMLCRHNNYVQRFGQIRDLGEIAKRERIWENFIDDLEKKTGRPAGEIPATEFRVEVDKLSFA